LQIEKENSAMLRATQQ